MAFDTLPKRLSAPLLEFCRSISEERPVIIRSRPSNDAQSGHCFDNVARKIERAGGGIAYGWAIWHLPGAYFEAEHHGVWKKRSGELLDVSPQYQGYRKLVFLPDPAVVYDPAAFQPNRVMADGNDPRSLELVDVVLARYALLDACRARGMICPDAKTQWAADSLLQRISALLADIQPNLPTLK